MYVHAYSVRTNCTEVMNKNVTVDSRVMKK